MFKLFGGNKQSVLGVDIGNSSLKLVALSFRGKTPVLDGFGVISLPEKSFVDGSIEKPEEVADAIVKAQRLAGVKATRAITSVAASDVITKEIQISELFYGFDLEEQVKIEADQFIPYPIEDVALDFEVLGPVQGNPAFNRIGIVACRRDGVSAREDCLDLAGLQCDVVDVDTYVYERALPPEELMPGRACAIVDFGAHNLTFYAFKDGLISYHREHTFGGEELLQQLQLYTELPHDELAAQLRHGELDPSLISLMESFADSAVQQVSRALQFYSASGSQEQLSTLYITGGLASLPGIKDKLSSELGITVHGLDPFERVEIASQINMDRLNAEKNALTKALSLALRGVGGQYENH